MDRIQPSYEQMNIISTLLAGNNVVINAVPGSGKTTTVFFFTLAYRQLFPMGRNSILQLTYNKALRMEVKARAYASKIDPYDELEVHTYHSFLNAYVAPCPDDNSMRRILSDKTICFDRVWDYLIIDEAQDITPLYFELIVKILKNVKKNVCVLGDSFQGVYAFKGSDSRFLTFFPYLVEGLIPLQTWRYLPLNISYRLTPAITDFINLLVLGERRIISHSTGASAGSFPRVVYIRSNIWSVEKILAGRIRDCLGSGRYRPQDIFILAPSISCNKNLTPIRKLENYLIQEEFPCYVPSGDEMIGVGKENMMKDKIVFSTFHQSKGRERKIVILLGFDTSYFEFYDSDNPDPSQVPSALYVAMSRASDTLILVEGLKAEEPNRNTLIPFLGNKIPGSLNYSTLQSLPYLETLGNYPKKGESSYGSIQRTIKTGNINLSVTQLLKFFSYSSSSEIFNYFTPILQEICPSYFVSGLGPETRSSVSSSKTVSELGPETRLSNPEGSPSKPEGVRIPSYVICHHDRESMMCEDVSAINGVAIPAILEFLNGSLSRPEEMYYTSIEHFVLSKYYVFLSGPGSGDEFNPLVYKAIDTYLDFLKQVEERGPGKFSTIYLYPDSIESKDIIEKYLRVSTIYLAMRGGYLNSLKQINKFDWLTPEMVNACLINLRMSGLDFTPNLFFEKYITPETGYEFGWNIFQEKTNSITEKKISLVGVVDAIDQENVYEFKCVESLKIDHLLQLIIYAWIWHKNYQSNRNFSLINIRTGEKHTLNLTNLSLLDLVVSQIINDKFNKRNRMTDQEFVVFGRNLTLFR